MRSRAHIPRNCCYKERTSKFNGTLHEESEEAIVLMTERTTKPINREGPLLQPCRAGR